MSTREKIEVLKSFRIFRIITPEDLKLVAEKAREKNFSPKSLIISQTDTASSVFLVYKGLVEIYFLTEEGKIIPIRLKEPPYILGENRLFDRFSIATVEAVQEVHTLSIAMQDFTRLILTYPEFGYEVLRIVIEKLRAANNQTIHYVTQSLKERTWLFLQTMAPHYPNREINLSHDEISLIVGASRARITEILNELQKQKYISLSQRKIHVH